MTSVESTGDMNTPIHLVATDLHERINNSQAKVGVIGLGYVGLPLATAFAGAGSQVIGFDLNQNVVDGLNSGVSHIRDVSSDELAPLVASGSFRSSSDMSLLSTVDVIVICVPTPLSKTRTPDISYIESASRSVAEHLVQAQLVVLESTTYPGTTRDVVLPILAESGLEVGEDFFLAYSPERIDPGNAKFGVRNTPKVIGGIDDASTELATVLYAQIVEECVPVTTPEAAEMTKLLENTFRAVNIGLANETAIMCDRMGIDVWEVIRAASTKPFGFMPFYPGPGIGGHCIPLDPHYLAWKMQTLDYRARFIELANDVNSAMPFHVVARISDSLNLTRKPISGSRLLVLGVAYKPNIDDMRESPAIEIIEELIARGAEVTYHDPFVGNLSVKNGDLSSVDLTHDLLQLTDCVVIITNHAGIDYQFIVDNVSLVVDTRNALAGLSGRAQVATI